MISDAKITMMRNPALIIPKAASFFPRSATQLDTENIITVNNVKVTGIDRMASLVGVIPIKVKKISAPAIMVALIWRMSLVPISINLT